MCWWSRVRSLWSCLYNGSCHSEERKCLDGEECSVTAVHLQWHHLCDSFFLVSCCLHRSWCPHLLISLCAWFFVCCLPVVLYFGVHQFQSAAYTGVVWNQCTEFVAEHWCGFTCAIIHGMFSRMHSSCKVSLEGNWWRNSHFSLLPNEKRWCFLAQSRLIL